MTSENPPPEPSDELLHRAIAERAVQLERFSRTNGGTMTELDAAEHLLHRSREMDYRVEPLHGALCHILNHLRSAPKAEGAKGSEPYFEKVNRGIQRKDPTDAEEEATGEGFTADASRGLERTAKDGVRCWGCDARSVV